MTPAYIGLGANLGETQQVLKDAVVCLAQHPHITVLQKSSLYKTAPIDAPGDDFLNAVVKIETSLSAHCLLAVLHRIENHFGRCRPYPNAPRTLDLDLLLYGDQTLSTPELTLPHPRMAERAFVMAPLVEITPQLIIAGLGPVTQLLDKLHHQRIEKLPPCNGLCSRQPS